MLSKETYPLHHGSNRKHRARHNTGVLVTTLAQGDALAKLLIEKGLITHDEYMEKLSTERAAYQKLFNPTVQ
jgi:hypothetical protein